MPDRMTLLDLLLEATMLLQRDLEASLAREGLTPARTHLLWALAGSGPSTQQALAQALGTSPRNVTGLVDGLVETGFVTREPHPGDRRATLVTPTSKGRRTTEAMATAHGVLADQLFGDLSPAEADELTTRLTGLRDRLTVLTEAAG